MTQDEMQIWRKNMQGDRKDKVRSEASVRIDSAVHTYIVLRLSRMGISQVLAAKVCGTSPQFINSIIFGKKRSAEIQRRLAVDVLGLRSWQDLERNALLLQERIADEALRYEVKADAI